MKQLVLGSHRLLLVAVCLLVTVPSFAGAWVTARKHCAWYQSKFIAHASVKRSGAIFDFLDAKDKDCASAEAWAEAYFCATGIRPRKGEGIPYTPPTGNAFTASLGYAKAQAGYNGLFVDVMTGYGPGKREDGSCTPDGYFSGGHEPLDLPVDLAVSPIVQPMQATDATRRSSFQVGAIEYDEARRAFIIRELNATLQNQVADAANDFSALGISLNYIQDSNASTQAPPNGSLIISQTRMMLNNREVVRDGLLQNYSVTAFGDYCNGSEQVGLEIVELIVPVPAGIDPDQVEITIGGDSGNLGYGVDEFFYPSPQASHTTVRNTNSTSCPPIEYESMRVSSYPNPIVNGDFTVEAEINKKELVQIGIFNAEGTLVRSIYEGELEEKTKKVFKTSTAGLQPGIYYLRLIGDKRSLIRRLIIKQ